MPKATGHHSQPSRNTSGRPNARLPPSRAGYSRKGAVSLPRVGSSLRNKRAVRMYTATHRARLHQEGVANPHSQAIKHTWPAPNTSMPGTKLISSKASAMVHSTKNQNAQGVPWPWGKAAMAKAALPTARKLPAHLATRLSFIRPAERRKKYRANWATHTGMAMQE